MSLYYVLFAFCAGMILPIQIGINATLAKGLGNPLGATTISFFVGTLALVAYQILTKTTLPTLTALGALPWWTLAGGLLGALYVATTIFCAPELGSTLLVVLVVTGQMLISLVLDHYGLVGFPMRPITIWRVTGALMLIGSVIIFVKN